jgi:hypothetical protein
VARLPSDPVSTEALSSLVDLLQSLLPAAVDPALRPTVVVSPRRIVPTGLGGFVGWSHSPEGDLLGRRVEALAHVQVRAATLDELSGIVANVTRAFVTADAAALRSAGILRIDLEALGPPPVAGGEATREVTFGILYEFVHQPVDDGDTILTIPFDLELDRGRPRRVLLSTGFAADALGLFDVVDDPAAGTSAPSDWQVNVAEARIEQRSRIRGGGLTPTPNKPGTYLVLRTTAERPPVTDFILRATVRSDDTGGIGLVFRFQDVDNFYFFLMDSARTFRLLLRKVGGAFEALDSSSRIIDRGYEPGRLYDLKVSVEGPSVQVFLDGDRILRGRDATLPDPGRVGFMSRNNNQSFFYRIDLEQL